MSASRSAMISAAEPDPVLVLLKVGDDSGDFLLRVADERLQIDGGLLRQRPLQMRHGRARRAPSRPNAASDSKANWISVSRSVCCA